MWYIEKSAECGLFCIVKNLIIFTRTINSCRRSYTKTKQSTIENHGARPWLIKTKSISALRHCEVISICDFVLILKFLLIANCCNRNNSYHYSKIIQILSINQFANSTLFCLGCPRLSLSILTLLRLSGRSLYSF